MILFNQSMIISDDGFNFDNLNQKQLIIPVFKDSRSSCSYVIQKYGNSKILTMVLASKYLDDNNDYNGQLLFYTSKNATEWHYANNYRD
ncbi:MAG: hypothetical protein ACLS85_06240 [Coprobacillus cateniformis]